MVDPAGREELPPLQAITWPTKSGAAYASLRERVLDGSLRPGAVLEQEALARQLGLSTTPVREAVRRLEAEGLIVQLAHKAIQVPALNRAELDDLYSVRMQLDPYAAQLGARNATDGIRRELRALTHTADPDASPRSQLVHNRKLHRAMYAASGNIVLRDLLDGLWDRSDRYRMVLLRDEVTAHAADDDHHELVELFCARKTKQLGEALKRHLQGSHDKLRAILD